MTRALLLAAMLAAGIALGRLEVIRCLDAVGEYDPRGAVEVCREWPTTWRDALSIYETGDNE